LLPFGPESSVFYSAVDKPKIRIYKTIILPVVLYGCEIWSLLEHRLRAFEGKRDEVTGGRMKLHNEELRDLYSSPSLIRMIKSRKMKLAGNIARMRVKSNAYRLLVRKPEGKRPLGRPRCKWVANIEMDVGETGWSGVDWICPTQDRDK
jgi:hypothetical protein